MDLSKLNEPDLFLTALKGETESREFYSKLAGRAKNFLLKDRLNFLAQEEEKHRSFFEMTFKERFPGKSIVLPKKNVVPLPELKIPDEKVPISIIFLSAMQAEKAAYDFYTGLSNRLAADKTIGREILYIAAMEMGHYRLLEIEKENAEKYEGFDIEWPMTHVGP
jgi:rubrerythrin